MLVTTFYIHEVMAILFAFVVLRNLQVMSSVWVPSICMELVLAFEIVSILIP